MNDPEGLNDLEELVHTLLRDGKGLEALQAARQVNLNISNKLISDALDATSMSLAFARQRGNEEEIQKLESELNRIKEEFGDPHA